MSSIRPLVTITIIVVVGVFLYTKINEGPARVSGSSGDASGEATAEGVPALAAPGSADGTASLTPAPWGSDSNVTANTAPQWASGVSQSADPEPPTLDLPSNTNEPNSSNQTAAAGDRGSNLPDLPAIPELPSFGPTDNETNSTAASPTKSRIDLPPNIPTARYPDAPTDPEISAAQSVSPPSSSTAMPTMRSDAADNMPTLNSSAASNMPTMSPSAPPFAASAQCGTDGMTVQSLRSG